MENETKSVKEVYDYFHKCTTKAHALIQECLDLSNKTGLCFSYSPVGFGRYVPALTKEQVLTWVESGDYNKLDYDDQERADEVLNNDEDLDADDDYEYWRTSFC